MLKNFFILFIGLMVAGNNLKAQHINDLWLSIPDSIMPSVSQKSRREMLNHVMLDFDGAVKNKFDEPVRIDSMATDFMQVTLSESEQVQLLLMPGSNRDSVICLIRTFYGPAPESTITIYNNMWGSIGAYQPSWETFLAHPDTMSDEEYHDLCGKITPILYQATWNGTTRTLQLNLSLPFLTKEEREKIHPLILQRNLKWDGKNFK